MNCYIFLLYFIAVPSTFGDDANENALEADRARSTWNFGGGGSYPLKRGVYLNRPKNVAGPGSILTNRRMGSGVTPMAPYIEKWKSPSVPQRRRQSTPYFNPAQQGRPLVKRHTDYIRPFSTSPQSYPVSHYPNQQRTPLRRSSRKLSVDNIKNRFMKEDLWHLDKGESYPVRDEDLERDNMLRNRNFETNEIDQEQSAYLHQLEKDAETMISQGEKGANSTSHTEKENSPRHIHHHHHYEPESDKTHPKKELQKKKPVTNVKKLVPAPMPRIHNPIPLGCLLAVPVFHPIRPRHHLACLLSIPGTPSLSKRRRKRSADLPPVNQLTQSESDSIFQRLLTNFRVIPTTEATRKRYPGHVGNGRTPTSSSPAAQQNFKVPATIIAPPNFDQDDILSMLLGSGGVQADKLGTIVATNNRYVRYGRGLPNGGNGGRQGRNLPWMTTDSNSIVQSRVPPKVQSPVASGSHHVPSVIKTPVPHKTVKKPVAPVKNPIVHLTPPASSYAPFKSFPKPPMILNVQISPMSSPRVPSRPVITVPVQPQPSVNEQQQAPPTQLPQNIKQILQSNTEQSPQHQSPSQEPKSSEQQEKEKLNTEEQHQQQQWIIDHLIQRLQQINMEKLLEKYQQQQQSSSNEQPAEESTTEYSQQKSTEHHHRQEEQSSTPQNFHTVPYQVVSLSREEEVKNYENSNYGGWMPLPPPPKKSKPQKTYNYVKNVPSESKQLYRKVKASPFLYMQDKEVETDRPFTVYENNNAQVFDSGIPSTNSGSNDYQENSFNVDFGSVDSFYDIDAANHVSDPIAFSNSWKDVQDEGKWYNDYIQPLWSAKKKNYKDELDSVLQDISNGERGIYSNVESAENYDRSAYDSYDDIARFVSDSSSSKSEDKDGSVYSQEKYYTAKRLPEQSPDPIFISVPKDNGYSNELYDANK